MEQIEGNFDQLDDAEAREISEFLIETMSFMMESQRSPEGPQVEPQIPMGADLLWILSGNDPNRFVNYLRTFPGAGLQELAANPNQLANVIEQLQRTIPQREIHEDAQGIQDTEFPSSNVEGMKYDPNTRKLLVKFHGENQQPVYQYEGVPPQIFQLIQHGNAFAKTRGKNKWGEWWPFKNPSIGSSVNQYLKKGGYAYQRIK